MPYNTDCFTFNGGKFRFVLASLAVGTPRPKAPSEGQWVHVPYNTNGNGNVYVTGPGRLHTVWTPPQGIIIPSSSDFNIFYNAAGNGFHTLTVPWGSEEAQLTAESIVNLIPYSDGTYRGQVTWEWA